MTYTGGMLLLLKNTLFRLSIDEFRCRSVYCDCCLERTCLLHLLCCVHSGMWSFTLGFRCIWSCGEHQTAIHISSLASLAGFPGLADLANKHLHRPFLKVNDSQQMCCFVCRAPSDFLFLVEIQNWNLN